MQRSHFDWPDEEKTQRDLSSWQSLQALPIFLGAATNASMTVLLLIVVEIVDNCNKPIV
jgi:hypothetical protein